jgi:FecR protein
LTLSAAVVVASLWSVAVLSADVVVNPFAGTWSTFNNTGTLNLQVVDATKGAAAVNVYSGGNASTLCPPPTVFYTGSYQVVNGDAGQVAGCTNNGGVHLRGWYKSGSGQQHGTIDLDIQSGDTSFKGGYVEQSNATRGDYNGSFKADFPGSGRTQLPPTTTTTTSSQNAVGVVSLTPEVSFRRGQGGWQDLHLGQQLFEGDEIAADPDGTAVLRFADGTTVTIYPTSQLKIASYFTQGGIVRSQILDTIGRASATVNKEQSTRSDFTIRTPTAVTSSRGTIFSVYYDGAVSIVSVQRGVVDVTPSNRSLPQVLVPAGKEVGVSAKSETKTVPLGQAGTPPGAVSRVQARALVLQLVGRNERPCAFTPRTTSVVLTAQAHGWLVAVKVTGKVPGWSTWKLTGTKVTPLNGRARSIATGCRSRP